MAHPRPLILNPVTSEPEGSVAPQLGTAAIELIPLLGSVMHQRRLQVAMERFQVETVYHAAAYKHVPIVERNPIEGVRNNVFGTWRTAEAAIAAGVGTFVLIASDKAGRRTNVMGATKRLAELSLQGLAEQSVPTQLLSLIHI